MYRHIDTGIGREGRRDRDKHYLAFKKKKKKEILSFATMNGTGGH